MGEERLCYKCRENVAGRPEQIEFEHQGIKFSVFKGEMNCSRCEQEIVVERFEKYRSYFIQIEKGKAQVDWKKYVQFCESKEELRPKLTHILIDLGILSWFQEGNWEVSAGLSGMNPRQGGCYFYFTREKDIREYTKERYSRTSYSWVIKQASRIITKEEVLGVGE